MIAVAEIDMVTLKHAYTIYVMVFLSSRDPMDFDIFDDRIVFLTLE